MLQSGVYESHLTLFLSLFLSDSVRQNSTMFLKHPKWDICMVFRIHNKSDSFVGIFTVFDIFVYFFLLFVGIRALFLTKFRFFTQSLTHTFNCFFSYIKYGTFTPLESTDYSNFPILYGTKTKLFLIHFLLFYIWLLNSRKSNESVAIVQQAYHRSTRRMYEEEGKKKKN